MTSTASANRPTAPLLMLLGGLFLFSIQDVLISDLTKRYPVHEIVFVRSLVNIWPLILLSFAFDQGKNMQITKFWQLFLRGGLLSLSYTAYYLALAGLDFAQATSLYFTAPLFITFLSWVTTRVPIGWRRLTGVIIGLVGVVFIVKPGVGDIPLLPALMAVASAFFYALSALMTNWLGRTESTTVQSVTFVIMNLIIGALFWAIFGEGWAVDHAPEGLEVLLKALQPRLLESRVVIAVEVVDSHHRLPLLQQALHHSSTDEPCCTSDQDGGTHTSTPSAALRRALKSAMVRSNPSAKGTKGFQPSCCWASCIVSETMSSDAGPPCSSSNCCWISEGRSLWAEVVIAKPASSPAQW